MQTHGVNGDAISNAVRHHRVLKLVSLAPFRSRFSEHEVVRILYENAMARKFKQEAREEKGLGVREDHIDDFLAFLFLFFVFVLSFFCVVKEGA